MKWAAIPVGIGDRYDKKYMDGRCKIRGLRIEGDSPERIAEAERLRRQVLQEYAGVLHSYYTGMSVGRLEQFFRVYKVDCLGELIRKQTAYAFIYLLTLYSAEDVIAESKRRMRLPNLYMEKLLSEKGDRSGRAGQSVFV